MGINIRPADQVGGWDGRGKVSGGREVDKPLYRPFGVAVATWSSYNLYQSTSLKYVTVLPKIQS